MLPILPDTSIRLTYLRGRLIIKVKGPAGVYEKRSQRTQRTTNTKNSLAQSTLRPSWFLVPDPACRGPFHQKQLHQGLWTQPQREHGGPEFARDQYRLAFLFVGNTI